MENTITKKKETLTIRAGKLLLASLPDATEGLTYCCIGANCWGKNKNATKAAINARKEGDSGEYVIHLINEDCEIDPLEGTLYYNSKTPNIKLSIARFRQS